MSGQSSKQSGSGLSLSNLNTSGSSNNQFNQNVWGGNQGALSDIYSQAGSLFQNNSGLNQNNVTGATNYMNQIANQAKGAWGDQAAGGAYKGIGINDILNNLLTPVDTTAPSNMQSINNMIMGGSGNNYADAMKQQYIQDATNAQNNMLSNLDARATASGMSGGSRHGIATALGERDINQNLQRNLAETGFNTFDKDLDRKLNIASQADQATLARQQMNQQGQTTNLQALMDMLSGKQTSMNQGISGAQDVQGLGMSRFLPSNQVWQGLQNYSSVIGGPLVLNSGTGSSNTNTIGSNFGTSSSSGKSGGGGI